MRTDHTDLPGSRGSLGRRRARTDESLRGALAHGLRRARGRLRNHRAARTRPRARTGRQDHEPARRPPHDRAPAVRSPAPGAGRDRARRLLALEALSRRARPRPRGCRQHARTSRRTRERDRLRAALRHRRRDPDELRRILRQRQEDDQGRIRVAGRPLARRNRRGRHDRRRDLPARPRAAPQVPRRFEDRADEAGLQEMVHRCSEPSDTSQGRSSSGSSGSSSSRRRSTTGQTRRSVSTAPSRSSTTRRSGHGYSAPSQPG